MLPYKDPKLPVEERLDDLISRMTLDELIMQIDQYNSNEFGVFTGGKDDLCAICAKKSDAFAAHGIGHGQNDAITASGADGGKSDACVSGGRFDDSTAGGELSCRFGFPDHGECDTVFGAACGIAAFELGCECGADVVGCADSGEFYERGAADQGFDGRMNAHNVLLDFCLIRKVYHVRGGFSRYIKIVLKNSNNYLTNRFVCDIIIESLRK